ncbi:MAG: penicillin-binding protein activator LpoB [Candidatus Krumholzibacteria bacterium]|nr:penicillin-binding protein activator LpoB [Candidatus Krumholzibacteria bacterium]
MNRIPFLALLATLLAVALLAGGCSSGKTVTRVDPEEQIDLSGRWNDTDSRLVSDEMISDCLTRPWRSRHWEENAKRPVVIVGEIRNKSSEHIAVGTFIGDIERSFINSGEAEVVASSEEREGVRDERADQQKFSSEESMKKWGRELGADYMLSGVINSIEDKEGGEMVVFYQIDLNLIDLERNTKVWQGQKKIKKYIARGKYSP